MALRIDRHVLASNASSFNTAWETFGWTPAIAGVRAGRLEETVPWATRAARAPDPPRLAGPAAVVAAPANLDRLPYAFLPLDDRLGLCVWGAVGDRTDGASEWRVLTHTLLFDGAAFEAMAGNPFALLRRRGQATSWFRDLVEASAFAAPGPLEPIVLESSRVERAAFERERREEIARLRQGVLALFGGDADRLEVRLGALYEALAGAEPGGSLRHVALRATADRRNELLVRLAWLSLPLADRANVFFNTEQRRTEHARARLLVLPDEEWGRFVPSATRLVDDDAMERVDVSAGRAHWAWALSSAPGSFDRLSGRAELRGWRLIARDDIGAAEALSRWRLSWARRGPAPELARELIAIEKGAAARAGTPVPSDAMPASHRRCRWRAIGHVAALAAAADAGPLDGPYDRVAADADRSLVETLLDLIAPLDAGPRAAALTAALRTLRRRGRRGLAAAARARCEAVLRAPPLTPPEDLFALLERECDAVPALLETADGAPLLFRAATCVALDGHAAAVRLAGPALAVLPQPAEALEWLMQSCPLDDPRGARWAVRSLELAAATGRAGLPSGVVLEWLLPAARAGQEPARRHLRRPELLDRALASDSPLDVRSYLAAVQPGAIELADALERAIARGDGDRVALAADVVAWLSRSDVAPLAQAWAARAGDPLARLRIATHPAWGARTAEPAHGRLVAAALAAALRSHPPALEPETWDRLLDGAVPSSLLGAGALAAAVEWVDSAPVAGTGALPSKLLRRALADSVDPPDAVRCEALLRLLWAERAETGASETLDWLARERGDVAIGVLLALLLAPAPLPLFLSLRRALDGIAARLRIDRATLAPWRQRLGEYAPALLDSLSGPAPSRFRAEAQTPRGGAPRTASAGHAGSPATLALRRHT